jgi:hypothetical protein
MGEMRVLELKPDLPETLTIPPETQVVQFRRRLTRSDYATLARALQERPDIRLRAYQSGAAEFTDLDFLQFFPFIRKLSIDCFWLSNIEGFQYVRELDEFTFGQTKSKAHSLNFLARFPTLRKLYLDGHKKGIEVLAGLPKIESLTLRSITLPDLDLLVKLPRLQRLEIILGGTVNIRALRDLERLKFLRLCLIKNLRDVSVIEKMHSLEAIQLRALRNVTELPSFRELRHLREVYLETMKGLVDIRSVAEAESLETLSLIEMTAIDPKLLRSFVGHPALREFTAGLGSLKRNAYAEALLGLPARVWLPPGRREQAALEILVERSKEALN